MTSPISPLSPVPIDDLRRRVREAEALLGVAKGLARDELHDPGSCERARDRILSILREIDALFPGMSDPPPSIDPAELIAPSMRDRDAEDAAAMPPDGPSGAGEDAGGSDADAVDAVVGDEPDGEDEEIEWELDRKKLAAAIENEQLMSKIPEVDRAWFKSMALRSIEAQERVELCERVRRAFDELSTTMREGLDQTSKQLSVAMTFEQLRSKQQPQ